MRNKENLHAWDKVWRQKPEIKEKRRIAYRKWKQRNREKINARNRELYATNPAHRERNRKYVSANRQKIMAARRLHWAKMNPEKKRESLSRMKAWAEANPEKVRANQRRQWLRRKYKLTPEAFDKLMKAHNNACAICETSDDLTIDHNHTTGTVRGILCRRCNFGIGYFLNDAHKMRQAARYMEQISS